jgi:DDE superfamily endonuclease
MWCIPPKQSSEFVYHREDVLAVYQQPPDPQRPVVCVDETFQQLIGEVREPLPVQPGAVERYDSVYVRNGVASLFVAFEPLAAWRHVAVTDHRRRGDWAHFVADLLEGPYREASTLVLVMDQLNTHSPASFYEAFAPEKAKRLADRLEIHYTPKHGSWLNMAEIERSVLARDLPERVGNRAALQQRLSAWEQSRNRSAVKANWQFTRADARVKLRKLYPTIEG